MKYYSKKRDVFPFHPSFCNIGIYKSFTNSHSERQNQKTKDKFTNKFHFCRQTKRFSTKLQLIRAQKKSIYSHHRFLCKQTFSSQNEKSGRQKTLLDTFANKENACELNSFRIFALCCRALPSMCGARQGIYLSSSS